MNNNLRFWILLTILLLGAPAVRANPVYTFDQLNAGAAIIGQDSWVNFANPQNMTVQLTTASHLDYPSKMAANTGQVSRVNNGSFSFGAHSATSTSAILQFDGRPAIGENIVFGLGRSLTSGITNRLGFVFGLEGSSFFVREAVFGAFSTSPFSGSDGINDFYRLRMVADFTANGGDGAGSLYVMNLTDGETSFRPTPVFSGFNLGILNMDVVSQNASTWNSLYIRGGGANGRLDNLFPNGVPEPASLTVMGLAGGLLFRRRRGW